MMLNFLITLLGYLLFLCVVFLVLVRFFLSITMVQGYSMYPALIPGDRLLVLRHWPSKWLHRGQIIIGDLGKVLAALEKASPNSMLVGQEHIMKPASEHFGTVGLSESNVSIDYPHLEQCSSQSSEFAKIPPAKFIKRLTGLPGDTVSIRLSELHESVKVIIQTKADVNEMLVWHIPPGHGFVRGDGKISGDSIIWGPIPLKFLTGVVLLKLPSNLPPEQTLRKETSVDNQLSEQQAISLRDDE